MLGESLLASANVIIEALDEAESLGPLIAIAVLTLVVTASLWWVYFWPPHHRAITSIAVFLLGIWWIAIRDNANRIVNTVLPIGALVVLLDPLIPIPITLTAGIMIVIVVVLVIRPPVSTPPK